MEGGYNYQNPQNLRTNPSTGLSDRFDAGFVGGLTLGYATKFGLRPELELDYRRNDIRKFVTPLGSTTNTKGFDNAYTGFTNLWYDFKQPTGLFSIIHPYIGGGVGIARVGIRHFDGGGVLPINDFKAVFAYQGGAGVGFKLTDNLSSSIDLRYVETDRGNFNSRGSEVRARYRASSAMLGIKYSFGGPEPEPVRAAPPPPPAYVAPPPPPAPVPVDGDDDGDGVPNSRDKCPGTPKGFKVDADGCIIEQTVVLRAVNFEFNSDRLTQPAQETLDEVAKALIGQPTLNVQIGGYTDSKGSAAYNLNLSAKRAKSVKSYLVGKGVKSENLVSKGFGKAAPVASNDTEEGRAENRRVEFVVLNKPASVKVLTKESSSASKSAAEGTEPKPAKHRRKK
ncbi:MAG: hypothetical protein NVS9B10_21650 [Nevskia sp.]